MNEWRRWAACALTSNYQKLPAASHGATTARAYMSVRLFFPAMDVVAFTRQLVDIESTTGNEGRVADFLHRELSRLGYRASKMPVEGERCNVFATSPQQARPEIVFSTHMDTVPPFIPSSEDDTRIYGRGACDAKGIIAAQIAAAERLRQEGIYVGLLFVVGEEKDSLGAKVANQQSPGSKFLVNGEPTENRMASASKGTSARGNQRLRDAWRIRLIRNWGNPRSTSCWKP